MLQYNYIRKNYYEDNDVFVCWNMQQNSFYYHWCVENDQVDELLDIVIEINKVTNKERMGFVWKKSSVTRSLKNVWDNRLH